MYILGFNGFYSLASPIYDVKTDKLIGIQLYECDSDYKMVKEKMKSIKCDLIIPGRTQCGKSTTLILHSHDNVYIYVAAYNICEFELNDEIISFHSPIVPDDKLGHVSDIPNSFIVGKKAIYEIHEHEIKVYEKVSYDYINDYKFISRSSKSTGSLKIKHID